MSDLYEHDGPGNAGSVGENTTDISGDPCDAVRRTGLPQDRFHRGESSTEVASLRFFKKGNS